MLGKGITCSRFELFVGQYNRLTHFQQQNSQYLFLQPLHVSEVEIYFSWYTATSGWYTIPRVGTPLTMAGTPLPKAGTPLPQTGTPLPQTGNHHLYMSLS